MSKITGFDRSTCKDLSIAVIEALKEVGEKFGVQFKDKGGTFADKNFTMKIEAALVGKDGVVCDKASEDFKLYAHQFGLSAEDFMKVFTDFSGRSFQIVGLKPQSWKNPILGKDMRSGKTFKFPAEAIKTHLKR